MNTIIIDMIKEKNNKKSIFSAMVVAFNNIITPWIVVVLVCWAATISHLYYSLFPFIAFYIGTRFRAINNMSHECFHSSYCDSKKANEIFGEIFAIAEFSKFKSIRNEHITHHKHLGDYEKDMDFYGIRNYGLHKKITRRRMFRYVRDAILLRHIKDTFFFITYDSDAPLWSSLIRWVYIFILLALLINFPLWFLCFFVVPFCYFYQVQKHLTDIIDHGGLLNNADSINQTRNFIINNRLLSALLMPRFDGYHLVHHLLPWVCVESHKDAHAILMDDGEYIKKEHNASKQIRSILNDK